MSSTGTSNLIESFIEGKNRRNSNDLVIDNSNKYSSDHHSFLSCVACNARSLKNKLPDLHHLLYSQSPDVVLVSETWLHEGFPDSLLDPEGQYNIVRWDRTNSRGGGVAIFTSRRLSSVPVVMEAVDCLELAAVDIIVNRTKCRLINVYRKPSYSPDDVQYVQKLVKQLKKLCGVEWSTIIAGDINCPAINWSLLTSPVDGIQNTILDFICDNGFEQIVTEPTRENNILDVLMTNNNFLVSDVQVTPPLGCSDHSCVFFTVDLPDKDSHQVTSSKNVYSWASADYESLNNYLLQVDWYNFMSVHLTTESIWTAFKSVLFDAFDKFVPVRKLSTYNPRKRNYPRKLKRAFSRKKILWRRCKLDPLNVELKGRYRSVQVMCQRLLHDHELQEEKKTLESGDTGRFYKYVNKKLSCSTGTGSLTGRDGEAVVDNEEKANLLNRYFASVCVEDNGQQPKFDRQVSSDVSVDAIEFQTQNVYNIIKRLKPKTSSGPDGIPTVVLKNLGSSLAAPLALIFESFMSVGQVPDEWRSAIVTPLFKKGLPSSCANYRPVSLTCVICKVMEKIIVSQLLEYLRRHDIINKQQHGFLTRKSTVTNLLETFNDWTIALRDNNKMSAVYVDYSKAFDTVSHPKLFQKLTAYGIKGNLLNWIAGFLTDRKQITRVGESFSDVIYLKSGVVQGSCLGPLLFLLFINDVSTVLGSNTKSKLYADDVKLYSIVNTSQDISSFQNTLNRLKEWSDNWQLQISTTKCANINFTRSRYDKPVFSLGNVKLPVVTSVKDLGVTVDSDMKFNQHINNIVAHAKRRSGLLFKCFQTRNADILARAFIVYIRPLLEYASNIWSPIQAGLIEHIESVQRRYTKRIDGLQSMSYSERLDVLNLESLELRRLRADLITLYKLMFGLLDTNDSFFVRRTSTTRGHPFKIMIEHCDINIRRQFLSQRIANVWNSLPASIINFDSLNSFTNSLQRINLQIFTRY